MARKESRDRPENAPGQNSDQPDKGGPGGLPEPHPLISHELLNGRREVQIKHGDEVYRLRLTRGGKLILTKSRGNQPE